MPFSDVFGGSAVEASDVAYTSLNLTSVAPVQLYWPFDAVSSTTVAARIIDLTSTLNGTSIILPDATRVANGADFIFRNLGSFQIEVKKFGGGTLLTVAGGAVKYSYLESNATSDGTWGAVAFGVATGSLDAAQIQSYGLHAFAEKLTTAHPVTNLDLDITVPTTSRALLYNFNGGERVVTLSAAGTYSNDFFFLICNTGTGAITIQPASGQTIDTFINVQMNPGESFFVVTDGTNWYTVGRGRGASFALSMLVKNVAGSSNVTLTAAEATNTIIKLIGELTGNINVIIPSSLKLYIFDNETTGNFSLTIKTASGTGYLLPQAHRQIIYSDAVNALEAVTLPTDFVVQNFKYDIAFYVAGQLNVVSTVYSLFVVPRSVTLSATSTSQSICTALVATTGATTLLIKKNGAQIGTIVFTSADTTGTVSFTSLPVALIAGDLLTITTSGTVDATLANVGIVIVGCAKLEVC